MVKVGRDSDDGTMQVLRLLLCHGAIVDLRSQEGMASMEFAASHLGSKVVGLLLDHAFYGPDEVSDLLVHACRGLNAETLQMLLERGTSAAGLMPALKAGLQFITSVKEEGGRSISSYVGRMLDEKENITCVIREVRTSVVRMLLDAGADMHAVGEDIDFVKLLVQRDAAFC